MKTLAERLTYMIELRGLSGRRLASLADVQQTAVHRWAKGETINPGEEDLGKVAVVLGVSSEWLRTGIGRGPESMAAETEDPYTVLGALSGGAPPGILAAALEAMFLAFMPLGIGPDGEKLNEVLRALVSRSLREETRPTKEWALEEMAKLTMKKE